MRPHLVAGLLACAGAQASSSPFVLFSTSKTPKGTTNLPQIQTSSQTLETAKDFLSSCPTKQYILFSHPNTHASDIRNDQGCQAVNLCKSNDRSNIQGRINVAEVLGEISIDDLADYIKSACQARGVKGVSVQTHLGTPLPSEGGDARNSQLLQNDKAFGKTMAEMEGSKSASYTAIYFSSPAELPAYESDFNEPVQMELKRRSGEIMSGLQDRQARNMTRAPLFEKYQFFTPGLFMVFISIFVLLMILYAGISAVASLKIPYGAFEKDMGPASQKKQA